ncbi:MAG TPA: CBS domain-containing protein [Rhodocyclaceae bacterium]|nr:CBS domain-containing protein [Rhodocyclaceae bacterium]
MKIKDIMSKRLESIDAEATLMQAAERMRDLDTGALPVEWSGKTKGIITDRDIVIRCLAEGLDPKATKVGRCATEQVLFCYTDEDIKAAAEKMEQYQIRRLLVRDRNEVAVGVLSLGDLATHGDRKGLAGEVLEHVSMKLAA